FPTLADDVLDAVTGAADPGQAARYLRTFFARIRHPGVYIRLLGDDRRNVRRLADALGASSFLGDTLASQPELGDIVVFARGSPTEDTVRAEVAAAAASAVSAPPVDADDADDAFVGALRNVKARVTIECALADLAGELLTRDVMLVLSALADAQL